MRDVLFMLLTMPAILISYPIAMVIFQIRMIRQIVAHKLEQWEEDLLKWRDE